MYTLVINKVFAFANHHIIWTRIAVIRPNTKARYDASEHSKDALPPQYLISDSCQVVNSN